MVMQVYQAADLSAEQGHALELQAARFSAEPPAALSARLAGNEATGTMKRP
jgi:hypothetical protein